MWFSFKEYWTFIYFFFTSCYFQFHFILSRFVFKLAQGNSRCAFTLGIVTPLLRCESSKSLLHVPSDQHKNSTLTSGNSSASKSRVSSGNLSAQNSPMTLGLTLWFLPYTSAPSFKDSKGPEVDFWSSFQYHPFLSRTLPSTSNCLSLPELQSAPLIQEDHSALPGISLPAPHSGTTCRQKIKVIIGLTSFVSLVSGMSQGQFYCPMSENTCSIFKFIRNMTEIVYYIPLKGNKYIYKFLI